MLYAWFEVTPESGTCVGVPLKVGTLRTSDRQISRYLFPSHPFLTGRSEDRWCITSTLPENGKLMAPRAGRYAIDLERRVLRWDRSRRDLILGA